MNEKKAIKLDNLLSTDGDVQIPDPSGRKTILYFYPKDATPGCTTEGQNFRDNHEEFAKLGVVIYGVSKDTMKSHNKFKKKQGFPFELISDVEGELCEYMGIWRLKKFMGKEYMGIVRTTFLIDEYGEILNEWEVKRVKGHVEGVLGFVKEIEKEK
jgi:peroxiredoxin Q/BCP